MMPDLVDELRAACAWVAERAVHVRIDEDRIEPYAAAVPPGGAPRPGRAGAEERERLAAHWLTLDAINFGSGWFPTLRKLEGRSGYRTIAALLERHGPWSAPELAEIGADQLAEVLHQDPGHELMALFACSLSDLGIHLRDDYGGRFREPVERARGSAVALVELLAGWPCFADTSTYQGRAVPFCKRAQIATADLHRAGAASFGDLPRLTMFADNLVPHVLRLDGVLRFAPELVARIDREELIDHGSSEEVEIRACAVHAVELLVEARPGSCAAEIDQFLWCRGAGARYKASPRHRCRCTAY